MNRQLRQRGISLLEVLLSLTIIAIILVMATRYFFLATNNDRINMAREQIGSVVAAIHGWKNQNPQYDSSLSISKLYNDGFLYQSSNMVITGSAPNASVKLYNPWGTEITVQGATDHATLSLQLPKHSDCVSLQNSYSDAACEGSGEFSLSVS